MKETKMSLWMYFKHAATITKMKPFYSNMHTRKQLYRRYRWNSRLPEWCSEYNQSDRMAHDQCTDSRHTLFKDTNEWIFMQAGLWFSQQARKELAMVIFDVSPLCRPLRWRPKISSRFHHGVLHKTSLWSEFWSIFLVTIFAHSSCTLEFWCLWVYWCSLPASGVLSHHLVLDVNAHLPVCQNRQVSVPMWVSS